MNRPPPSQLPRDALGLGLRLPHYEYLFRHQPEVGYFEIITENFLGQAPHAARNLARVHARYPVVLHGVSLNLLGHEPLDERYLDEVCRLADRVDAAFVTDHLCWTGAHGIQHHDLLPMPYTADLVALAAERAATVQRRLGRPFGLENLSSYVTFRESTLSEHDFYTQVVREAGCHFMLDINNIYVSSVNHGFDPHTYLRAIDFSRVLQVHIAGHSREPDGTIIDTHDQPVSDAVWQLYAEAWKLGGPFPTLLEWDDAIPPLPEALAELERARSARANTRPATQRTEPSTPSIDTCCAANAYATQNASAALQARFSSVLRTPLDASSGSLRCQPEHFSDDACADVLPGPQLTAADRLGLYQRQYWLRLLRTLQDQYPLTVRLLGAFYFNQHALRFLSEQPPRDHDLGHATDGFAEFLTCDLVSDPVDHPPRGPSLPRLALIEAARIDAAYRRVFIAPEMPPLQLSAADEAGLALRRLHISPALAVLEEHWPLLQLRAAVLKQPDVEHATPLPATLDAPQQHLLERTPRGLKTRPLDPIHARLYTLLADHTVGQALGRLASELAPDAHADMPDRIQAFFRDARRAGHFTG